MHSQCLSGLGGVYKGLTATVIKQGTNQMIRFFVYTNLKSYLQGGDPSKDIGSIKTFIIGGIAGAASVFGNTPVDVVKTRMQVCCNSITVRLCCWGMVGGGTYHTTISFSKTTILSIINSF